MATCDPSKPPRITKTVMLEDEDLLGVDMDVEGGGKSGYQQQTIP